jgi:hypothetical protein
MYSLVLALDANFRLKNKDCNITNDPSLGDGWAHWVPEGPFKEYVDEYGYQEEVSLTLLFKSSWYIANIQLAKPL